MAEYKCTICPCCTKVNVQHLGKIPSTDIFAGHHLGKLLPGGSLWKCYGCHLVFRYPKLSKKEMDQLYQCGDNESWSTQPENREDWLLVRNILKKNHKVRRLLDVGCFDGGLLSYLEDSYEKLGIEIHPQAARKAEEKNIHIISHDFDELSEFHAIADAVIALDVIEHVENPLEFLRRLTLACSPDGLVIIGTGNTDACSWRLMGSRYWYCHFAEHISFINPDWAVWAAGQVGLKVCEIRKFSHSDRRNRRYRFFREAFLNIFYLIFPRVFAWLRKKGLGSLDVTRFPDLCATPPYWSTAQDHILIIFRVEGS